MTQSEPYQRPVVLIIDDEKLSRKMLSQVLEQSGYQVIEAESGQTGLAQFKTHSPDLVLLDLMMPDMDGYAVCEALRKLQCYQSLPILMLTGLNDVESVNHAFRVGATDFITKPINWPLLGERVRYALRSKAMYFELQQRTHEVNAILASASDAILKVDTSLIIEEANPAAETLFRKPQQDLQSIDVRTIIPHLSTTFPNPGTLVLVNGLRSDGSTFPAELNINEVELIDKKIYSFFIRDLSERQKIDRMKSEFISTVSHELRTPVAAIRGAAGLLAGGVFGELPDKSGQLLKITMDNCHRLEKLVNDILDINILDSSDKHFNITDCDPVQMISQSLNEYQLFADLYKSKLHFENPIDAHESVMMQVDADRFVQVLANLLTNAIKFSPEQSTINISLQSTDTQMSVFIEDQGPGITDGFRQRIFQKFAQGDSSDTRKYGGTGLGLYICKQIIEGMHGSIDYSNQAEGGAVFFFSLPKKQPQ